MNISRNQELANVFKAAAAGALAPYHPQINYAQQLGAQQGGFIGQSFRDSDYQSAKVLSSALSAIGAMYQKLADAEKEPK